MKNRYYDYIAIGFAIAIALILAYYRIATDRYVARFDLTESVREATRVPKKRDNLNYQDRQRFYKVLKWPESCENQFSSSTLKDFSGVVFYELTPTSSLVAIQCNQGGSVGGLSQYLWLDESTEPFKARLLFLNSYVQHADQLIKTTLSELVGEPTFNPATKLLTIVQAFRVNVNCGVAATYKFDGSAPVLVQARGTTQCYYPGSPNPSSWLVLPL